jgi:electron transport complex protein RnfG
VKQTLHMLTVLSLITLLSGTALGGLNQLTFEAAQNNILKFKKIPAVVNIYQVVSGTKLSAQERVKAEESLLAEKQLLDLGEEEPQLIFVIKKDNKPYAVALEDFGQGFGGALGVMVGFKLESGDLVGIGITTLAETPGVGTRVKENTFTEQFRDMRKDTTFKVKKDGGDIDAISGATISSRAVAQAVAQASAFYKKHEAQIKKTVEE